MRRVVAGVCHINCGGQEQLRRAGRDLAANLSRHGQGLPYFAARDLQNQIQDSIHLLSDNEIKQAFGVRDMWQVIERVAALHLGGSSKLVRHRTQAEAGSTIIRWLANRRNLLVRTRAVRVLKDDDIRKQRAGKRPSTDPTDYDFISASERWLAVAGTPDTEVDPVQRE